MTILLFIGQKEQKKKLTYLLNIFISEKERLSVNINDKKKN